MGADPNSEKVAKLLRDASLATFESPGYNMFANCTEEEKREWHVFLLFLVKHEGALVDGGVAEHVEGRVSFTDCEASLSSLRRISAKRSGTPSAMISAYRTRSSRPIAALVSASSLPAVAIFGSPSVLSNALEIPMSNHCPLDEEGCYGPYPTSVPALPGIRQRRLGIGLVLPCSDT